jgi:hypothetical protein
MCQHLQKNCKSATRSNIDQSGSIWSNLVTVLDWESTGFLFSTFQTCKQRFVRDEMRLIVQNDHNAH